MKKEKAVPKHKAPETRTKPVGFHTTPEVARKLEEVAAGEGRSVSMFLHRLAAAAVGVKA